MPRIPRNPGSGKAPHNGPARGRGYGGPAKGAAGPDRRESIAKPWGKGECGRPEFPSYSMLKKEERITALNSRLWDWATQRDPEAGIREAQTATVALLNREDGMPVQRQVTPENAPQWFIEGGREAESLEAWADQARLAHAKPAGSAD